MALSGAILGITHWHAERYARMLAARGARIVGASDGDALAGAAAAARHGLDFAADPRALLDAARPDFVLVLPRHDRALAEAAPAIERRLPMLIEKPLGRNAVEARATAAAIERAGIFASVCFPNRHLEIWDSFRTLADEGALGTVIHAHFRTINGPPARYRAYGVEWMLDPAISGGGALRNLGIHAADAALTLAGARALRLAGAAVSSIGHRGPVEDFATAAFATDDGFVATIEAGYSYASMKDGGDYEWRIAATGAYLRESNGVLSVQRLGREPERREVRNPGIAYEVMLDAALDAFRRGAAPPSPVADCVRAVELQDAIYARARTG